MSEKYLRVSETYANKLGVRGSTLVICARMGGKQTQFLRNALGIIKYVNFGF